LVLARDQLKGSKLVFQVQRLRGLSEEREGLDICAAVTDGTDDFFRNDISSIGNIDDITRDGSTWGHI